MTEEYRKDAENDNRPDIPVSSELKTRLGILWHDCKYCAGDLLLDILTLRPIHPGMEPQEQAGLAMLDWLEVKGFPSGVQFYEEDPIGNVLADMTSRRNVPGRALQKSIELRRLAAEQTELQDELDIVLDEMLADLEAINNIHSRINGLMPALDLQHFKDNDADHYHTTKDFMAYMRSSRGEEQRFTARFAPLNLAKFHIDEWNNAGVENAEAGQDFNNLFDDITNSIYTGCMEDPVLRDGPAEVKTLLSRDQTRQSQDGWQDEIGQQVIAEMDGNFIVRESPLVLNVMSRVLTSLEDIDKRTVEEETQPATESTPSMEEQDFEPGNPQEIELQHIDTRICASFAHQGHRHPAETPE